MKNENMKNVCQFNAGVRATGRVDLGDSWMPACAGMSQCTDQSGRSMVEMLGVLAVMGVLSVGAIGGYNYAMNKYRANEILKGVSARAMTASMEKSQSNTLTLAGYADNINGYTVASDGAPGGDSTRFSITVSGVSESVCDLLLQNKPENTLFVYGGTGTSAQCSSGNNTVAFVFNNNLSTDLKSYDYDGDEAGCTGAGYTLCADDTCRADCCAGVDTTCQTCAADGTITPKEGACTIDDPNDGVCSNGACVADQCQDADYDAQCQSCAPATGEITNVDDTCDYNGGSGNGVCDEGECVNPCPTGTSPTGAGGFVPGSPCACEESNEGWTGSSCSTEYEEPEDDDLGACATNAECANVSGCENGVCFCNYKGNVDCENGPSGQVGQCQVRQFGRLPSGAASEGFFRSKSGTLDWYSAQNFCESYHNGEMVHVTDIGIGTASGQHLTVPTDSCSSNTSCGLDDNNGTTAAQKWKAIQAKFGKDYTPWTADLYPSDSCIASGVFLKRSGAGVGNLNRYNSLYALCR